MLVGLPPAWLSNSRSRVLVDTPFNSTSSVTKIVQQLVELIVSGARYSKVLKGCTCTSSSAVFYAAKCPSKGSHSELYSMNKLLLLGFRGKKIRRILGGFVPMPVEPWMWSSKKHSWAHERTCHLAPLPAEASAPSATSGSLRLLRAERAAAGDRGHGVPRTLRCRRSRLSLAYDEEVPNRNGSGVKVDRCVLQILGV